MDNGAGWNDENRSMHHYRVRVSAEETERLLAVGWKKIWGSDEWLYSPARARSKFVPLWSAISRVSRMTLHRSLPGATC